MSLIKEEKVYFYGLDEFRAVAAILVYFHHLEYYKMHEGFSSLLRIDSLHPFIQHAGRNAVIAFFVLSGFLITYLLLREKEKTGTINVKAFYIRRVLRIWPLYFFVVFIGFVLLPLLNQTGLFNDQKTWPKLINQLEYASLPLFLLFLSNFALKYFKPVAGASQSWSVSVEEQFYLLWPNIIKYAKGLKVTVFVIACIVLGKLGLVHLLTKYSGQSMLLRIINIISIQDMCVGALAAILLFSKGTFERVKPFFESRILLFITVTGIITEMVMFDHPVTLSVLFGLLILLVVNQRIEIGFLKYFGKISYGIYMLHPLMIFLSFSIAMKFQNKYLFNIVLYALSFSFTIIASSLSYKYIETPFLKYKSGFTIIESGSK
jgi:peptidoglycan/LPS O-acetylase OafA/YrhL